LPAGFDLTKSRGLGMRIIAALAKQLGASITQHGGVDGTEFALLLPLERRSES
jgi:two-component sensor histidine kinase